jgi:hypothetical protein
MWQKKPKEYTQSTTTGHLTSWVYCTTQMGICKTLTSLASRQMGYWKNSDICCLKANGYLQNSDIPCLKENVYWKTLTYLAARRMGIFKTDIPCFKENGYWKTLTSLASWQMGIAKLWHLLPQGKCKNFKPGFANCIHERFLRYPLCLLWFTLVATNPILRAGE